MREHTRDEGGSAAGAQSASCDIDSEAPVAAVALLLRIPT
jgi:hypothetical protein